MAQPAPFDGANDAATTARTTLSRMYRMPEHVEGESFADVTDAFNVLASLAEDPRVDGSFSSDATGRLRVNVATVEEDFERGYSGCEYTPVRVLDDGGLLLRQTGISPSAVLYRDGQVENVRLHRGDVESYEHESVGEFHHAEILRVPTPTLRPYAHESNKHDVDLAEWRDEGTEIVVEYDCHSSGETKTLRAALDSAGDLRKRFTLVAGPKRYRVDASQSSTATVKTAKCDAYVGGTQLGSRGRVTDVLD